MSEPGHTLHETRLQGRGVEPLAAFSIDLGQAPEGEAAITLSGELDMAAAPLLHETFEQYAGASRVVLNMAETTFIDSSALRELLAANAALRERGGRLVLAGVPGPVLRLLELTGTAELFELV
ncbi:MAG: hypothetical protein QOE28_2641 [Solirubrobacteraceae bacterium]|jgi:anti-anti-sigma factor|nr:hypothetical protein [Solirubrobacteraceae bacterium]